VTGEKKLHNIGVRCQKPRGSRRNHSATVPVLAPQFQLGGNGDEDDEEEEGVLDREGSNIEDDGDEVGVLENFFIRHSSSEDGSQECLF
jgi:hypothetical protein